MRHDIGTDEYGLPRCGTREQKRFRDIAMRRYRRAIKEQEKELKRKLKDEKKKKEKADKLRFFKKIGKISNREEKELLWLENKGY